MDIGGKRGINSVTGAAESGVAKRRRTEEPDAGAAPVVHEHFRWADLPRDLFCHLAAMLLLPEYLQLRLVSRTLRTRLDEIGPVPTATCAQVDLAKDWADRIGRDAAWSSTLKLSGSLTNIPHLAGKIAAGSWTTLDLLDARCASLAHQDALLSLLQQLEQGLPEGRGLSRRHLYLRVASSAITPVIATTGPEAGAVRFRPAEYTRPLIHVLQKLAAAGKLSLGRLVLDGCSMDHPPLLQLGDLDQVTLQEGGWPGLPALGTGQGAPVPQVALALAALGDGGTVGRLSLDVFCDTTVEALMAYCGKKKVESLEVRFPRLGPDTITRLFALPLRLAHAWDHDHAPQEKLALLEGVRKNDSLEVVRIDSLRLQLDWEFIRSCKQKPRLKELRAQQFSFELGAGDVLGCTRLSLKPSEAADVLGLLKDDLGSLNDLQLLYEPEWGRAEIRACEWGTLASLKRLKVEGSGVVVFPWECLSLPRLSSLDVFAAQGLDLAIPPGELPRPPQLKNLALYGTSADFNEMLVLLRCCQPLQRVHLDCRFANGGASATALVVIATLELPALKFLSIKVRNKALRQHLLAKIDLKALRPEVKFKFLGEEDEEFAEPEDIAQAVDLINTYFSRKMAEKQQ